MNALLRSLLVLVAGAFPCLGAGCESRNSGSEENPDASGDVEPTGDLLTRVKWLVGRTTHKDYDASYEAEEKLKKLFPDAAGALLTLAKDPDYARRTLAVELLTWGKLGQHEKQVHAFIREAIKSPIAELRAAALDSMAGLDMPDFTKDLLKEKFKDPAAVVRKKVMNILWCREWSPSDRDMLLLVARGLTDKDNDVSTEAIKVLYIAGAKVKPAIDELRKLANHPNENVRGAVISSLAVCGPAAQDIPTILAACKDPKLLVQLRAIEALEQLDPTNPQATAAALAALDDSRHDQIAVAAARVLSTARPVKAKILAQLAKTIQDKSTSDDVRGACINALWTIGPAASSAVDLLIREQRKGEFITESSSVRALGRIAPEHPELIKRVKALIASGEVSHTEFNYIASLGKRSSIFAADLISAVATLPKKKSIVKKWIMEFLPKVRGLPPKQAIPVLTSLLAADDEELCDYACKTLGSMGSAAAAAVPALIKLIRRDDGGDSPNIYAIEALGKIGPAARNVVPLLKKYFADPGTHRSDCFSVWHSAAVALTRIDPTTMNSVVQALRDNLQHPGFTMQTKTLFTLGELGPGASAAIEDIKPLAADRDGLLFVYATQTLARIGQLGPMVEVAIEELESGDPYRQQKGCEILKGIVPDAKRALPALWTLWRRGSNAISARAAGAIHAITGEDIWGRDGSRMW